MLSFCISQSMISKEQRNTWVEPFWQIQKMVKSFLNIETAPEDHNVQAAYASFLYKQRRRRMMMEHVM
ncbi:unnamed protein product, partial [Vitis vinifera]